MPLGQIEDAERVRREIDLTQELVGDLVHPDKLFRPFGGGGNLDERLLNDAAVEHLVAGGYTVLTWNAVPGDWKDPHGWVQRSRWSSAARRTPRCSCSTTSRPGRWSTSRSSSTSRSRAARGSCRSCRSRASPSAAARSAGPLEGLVSDAGSRA